MPDAIDEIFAKVKGAPPPKDPIDSIFEQVKAKTVRYPAGNGRVMEMEPPPAGRPPTFNPQPTTSGEVDTLGDAIAASPITGTVKTLEAIPRFAAAVPAAIGTSQGFRPPTPPTVNEPGAGKKLAGAASDVIGGAMEAATVPALALGASAPITALKSIGAYMLASNVTEEGLKQAGVAPEYAKLSGRLVGLASGAVPIGAKMLGEKIDAHNAAAEAMLKDEQIAGRLQDNLDLFDPIKVDVNGKPHEIKLNGVQNGRPSYKLENAETGKTVIAGSKDSVESYIAQQNKAEEVPLVRIIVKDKEGTVTSDTVARAKPSEANVVKKLHKEKNPDDHVSVRVLTPKDAQDIVSGEGDAGPSINPKLRGEKKLEAQYQQGKIDEAIKLLQDFAPDHGEGSPISRTDFKPGDLQKIVAEEVANPSKPGERGPYHDAVRTLLDADGLTPEQIAAQQFSKQQPAIVQQVPAPEPAPLPPGVKAQFGENPLVPAEPPAAVAAPATPVASPTTIPFVPPAPTPIPAESAPAEATGSAPTIAPTGASTPSIDERKAKIQELIATATQKADAAAARRAEKPAAPPDELSQEAGPTQEEAPTPVAPKVAKQVAEYTNLVEGTQSRVHELLDGRFSVALHDLDAEEALPERKIFKDEAKAQEYAKEIVGKAEKPVAAEVSPKEEVAPKVENSTPETEKQDARRSQLAKQYFDHFLSDAEEKRRIEALSADRREATLAHYQKNAESMADKMLSRIDYKDPDVVNILGLQNPTSRSIFEKITGVKLGRTETAKVAAVRDWVGPQKYDAWRKSLADEAAGKRSAESKAAADKKLQELLSEPRVYRIGKEPDVHTTFKGMVSGLIEKGYTQASEGKRGAFKTLELLNPKTNNRFTFKKAAEINYIDEQLAKIDKEAEAPLSADDEANIDALFQGKPTKTKAEMDAAKKAAEKKEVVQNTKPSPQPEADKWAISAAKQNEEDFANYERLVNEADKAYESIAAKYPTGGGRTPTFADATFSPEGTSANESRISADDARAAAEADFDRSHLKPIREAKDRILEHANDVRGKKREFTDVHEAMKFLRERSAKMGVRLPPKEAGKPEVAPSYDRVATKTIENAKRQIDEQIPKLERAIKNTPHNAHVEAKILSDLVDGASELHQKLQSADSVERNQLELSIEEARRLIKKSPEAKPVAKSEEKPTLPSERGAAELAESKTRGAEKLQPGINGLIDAIYSKIEAGESLGNVTELNKLVEQHMGASRTSGEWTPKDAFDAMEAAVNKYLIKHGKELMEMDADKAIGELRDLLKRLTSQGVRTEEQLTHQQFSTPPTESYVVARAAGVTKYDVVLEPSAGNGGLAAFPKSIGAKVYVNEIAPRRIAMLKAAGFDQPTAHDGEIINAMLPPDVKPTVIIMNPPFSSGALKGENAKNKNKYGFNHVDSALQRLEPNGRLVAILGGGQANEPNGGASFENVGSRKWFDKVAKMYNIRANVRVDGKEYAKYGTAFATRIIVIDKDGPTQDWNAIKTGNVKTLEEAYNVLKDVAESRPAIESAAKSVEVSTGARGEVRNSGIDPTSSVGNRPESSSRGSGQPLRGSEEAGRQDELAAGSTRPTGSAGGIRSNQSDQRTDLRESESQPAAPQQAEPATNIEVSPSNASGKRSISEREREQFVQDQREEGLDLKAANKPTGSQEEDSTSYVLYKPTLAGPPHPGAIVETKTMATVALPEITYKPNLPKSVIEQGKLSAVQLEAISIAGQQNEIVLAGGYRASALIGDGTGVGKGRITAGILWDNWRHGRKRLVWVSEKWDLAKAAKDDLANIGAQELADSLLEGQNVKYGKDIEHEGVLFFTYAWLRSTDKKGNARVDQLQKWLRGNDQADSAYMAFDECVPAGTLIETPSGAVAIELLRTGDRVLGFNHESGKVEETTVLHTFQRETAEPLICVNGLKVTGNHPVWTGQRGYVRADEINGLDSVALIASRLHVYGDQIEVRMVQADVRSAKVDERERETTPVLRDIVLGEVADVATGSGSKMPYGEVEICGDCFAVRSPQATRASAENGGVFGFGSQPDTTQGSSRESGKGFAAEGICASERREWDWADESTEDAGKCVGVADGGPNCNGTKIFRDSDLLQDRHSEYCHQAGNRSRRGGASLLENEAQGQEEGISSCGEGLETSSIYKQADIARFGIGNSANRTSQVVFNIETGTANYFASGLLVHNCHNLKNAVVGKMGKQSQIGKAVKDLLENNPPLRIASLSATAATNVTNLGYLDRLGLWGPGTPFPTGFGEFDSQIASGGISAMEMVARELKAQGKYLSRTLSFKGVTNEIKQHDLTPEQIELYRTAAKAWRSVTKQIESTIENTTNGGALAKSRAMSQFYGAQLRFWSMLITTLKIPTAVELAQQAIKDGKSVVITLVNTNEAAQNREKTKAQDAENEGDPDEPPDYDFGPGEMLKNYVESNYPTAQWADAVDDQGKPTKVLVKDAEGNIVHNPQAIAEKKALLAELDRTLHMPENPLDILISQLGGHQKVAELTGRKEIYDRSTGKFVFRGNPDVKRDEINLSEMRAFQSGEKEIAVLSSAAGTGISLHAANDAKNQKRRYHITLQVGWSADKAMQMLGRTHRANQVSAPEYVFLTSDLAGEKRFVATIVKRLGSLGALSKGQKDANTGSDVMGDADVLSDQGEAATKTFYSRLMRGETIPGASISGQQILRDMDIVDKDGEVAKKDLTNVTRMLNRVLSLDPETQNAAYDYFFGIFGKIVEDAIASGDLDTGVKTLPGESFEIGDQRVISADPNTGAETLYYPVTAHVRTNRYPVKDLRLRLGSKADNNTRILRNQKTGKLVLAYNANPIVEASGSVRQASHVVRPARSIAEKVPNDELASKYMEVGEWAKSAAASLPDKIKNSEASISSYKKNAEMYPSSASYYKGEIEKLEKTIGPMKEELAEAQEAEKNPRGWAIEQWGKEHDASPTERKVEHHLIGGAVLRWWNPIRDASGRRLEIYTVSDSKTGQRVVGVDIPASAIKPLLERITGNSSTVNWTQLGNDVIKNNTPYELEGGFRVRRASVSRRWVIEVIPPDAAGGRVLTSLGLMRELGVTPIYYVPTNEGRTEDVLKRLLERYPVKSSAAPAEKFPVTRGESERGSLKIGPELVAIDAWVRSKFKEEGPEANLSGMGALRNLTWRGASQTEKAAPEVHTALLRASEPMAQARSITSGSIQIIKRALKDANSPYSWQEFFQGLLNSRLIGTHDRWLDFANQVQEMDDEQLEKFTSRKFFHTMTDAMEGHDWLPTDLPQTIAALRGAKDWETLRELLHTSYKAAAQHTATMMPQDAFNEMGKDAGIKNALRVFKENIEAPIAENHQLNEGVFSTALGPWNTYFPLIPMEMPEIGPGKRSPGAKPKNKQNNFATGLAYQYDAGLDALRGMLRKAVYNNTRAALIQSLLDSGWLYHTTDSEKVFRTPDGREFKGYHLEIKKAEKLIVDGKVTVTPAKQGVMPLWMYSELKPVLDEGERMSNNIVLRAIRAAVKYSLQGPADFAFHVANLRGTLIANTPFLGTTPEGKALSAPMLKTFYAIYKIIDVAPLKGDEIPADMVKDIAEMAKIGLVPSRYGEFSRSAALSEEYGGKQKRWSFAAVLFGPKGVDIRARLVMYRLAKELAPDATPQELHNFVAQLGNYNEALQSDVARFFKGSGIGPFFTAGSTMIINGLNAWTGAGPMPKDDLTLRLWQRFTGGALGVLAMWIAFHKMLTGDFPWNNKHSKLLSIPVEEGHGWIGKYRHSALGDALWGKTGVGYLGFAFFNPLVMRGARAMGLAAAYQTKMLGGTNGQAVEAAQAEAMNAWLHPALGPVPRAAAVAALGDEAYITGLRDRYGRMSVQLMPSEAAKAKPGLESYAKRTLFAIKELNAFYGSTGAALGEHTGLLEASKRDKGNAFLRMAVDLSLPGLVGTASNPWYKQNQLRQQQRGVR